MLEYNKWRCWRNGWIRGNCWWKNSHVLRSDRIPGPSLLIDLSCLIRACAGVDLSQGFTVWMECRSLTFWSWSWQTFGWWVKGADACVNAGIGQIYPLLRKIIASRWMVRQIHGQRGYNWTGAADLSWILLIFSEEVAISCIRKKNQHQCPFEARVLYGVQKGFVVQPLVTQ